jgi:hypothetical protein
MNAPVTQTIELFERRAPLASATWNGEARTVELTFSAGAIVQRMDLDGPYAEVLAVDGFTLGEIVPLLDNHRRDTIDARFGSVVAARTVGNEARATVQLFRNHPLADRLAAGLSDGARFAVSCGYTVETWSERTDPKTGERTKTAQKWTVREVSIVNVAADPKASTRSATMSETVTTGSEHPSPQPAQPARSAAAPETDQPAVVDRAAVNGEIRTIGEVAGLDRAWIDGQIDANATAEQARAAAFEQMQRRTAGAGSVRTVRMEVIDDSANDPFVRAAAVGEAFYVRIHPTHKPSERARDYIGLTIPEFAREALRSAGVRTTGMSAGTIIERALQTTSDFALALGDVAGRELRQAYQAAPSGIRTTARQTTAKDFRAKHRIQLSTAPTLEKVNEKGEFKSGPLVDSAESYKVETFGRIINMSRQVMVNDDINAFSDLTRPVAQAAAAKEAQVLADLLTQAAGAGPTMSDSKTLFCTEHGNLAAGADKVAPSIDTLSKARTAMRRQKGLAGEVISVTPKFVLVPPEHETGVEKILADIAAAKVEDAVPAAFRNLVGVVDPRLTNATAWYLVANPDEIDGLEYAYLEGEEGPQIVTETGFEVDGLRVRVRLDFGGGFVDWRSWYRNPGA